MKRFIDLRGQIIDTFYDDGVPQPHFAFYCTVIDEFETGFNTAFHGEPYFLYMGEVGFMPDLLINENWLPGTYRFGVWYTHDKKTRYSDGSAKFDDEAFYLSFDQMLYKENDIKDGVDISTRTE